MGKLTSPRRKSFTVGHAEGLFGLTASAISVQAVGRHEALYLLLVASIHSDRARNNVDRNFLVVEISALRYELYPVFLEGKSICRLFWTTIK